MFTKWNVRSFDQYKLSYLIKNNDLQKHEPRQITHEWQVTKTCMSTIEEDTTRIVIQRHEIHKIRCKDLVLSPYSIQMCPPGYHHCGTIATCELGFDLLNVLR